MDIEKLEGRELDVRVATEVMRWIQKSKFAWEEKGVSDHIWLPLFSTDIAAAMQVVEKMLADGYYYDMKGIVPKNGSEEHEFRFSKGMLQGLWASADTVAKAICHAAVLAKDAE